MKSLFYSPIVARLMDRKSRQRVVKSLIKFPVGSWRQKAWSLEWWSMVSFWKRFWSTVANSSSGRLELTSFYLCVYKCTVRLNYRKDPLKQMSEKSKGSNWSPIEIGGNIPVVMKKMCVVSVHVMFCRAGGSSTEDSQRLVEYVLNQVDRFSSICVLKLQLYFRG